MASPFPGRSGRINAPPPQIAETRVPIFRDMGWLSQSADMTATRYGGNYGGARKVPDRTATEWTEPQHTFWRLQPQPTKVPQRYGTSTFSLGHYQPFHVGVPIGVGQLAEVGNSGYQPYSRGGHVLISITEMAQEGGPAAAMRRFANTRMGLWFKAWVVGGANVRPGGSVQTPSPQFRGVMPNFAYNTLPSVIGG